MMLKHALAFEFVLFYIYILFVLLQENGNQLRLYSWDLQRCTCALNLMNLEHINGSAKVYVGII